MLTSGHLVLVLAVVASQVDPHLSAGIPTAGQQDIECSIFYFSREYKTIQTARNNGSHWLICSDESEPDCVYVEDPEGRYAVEINTQEVTKPGSLIHTRLPRIKSASTCRKITDLQDENKRTRLLVILYSFGSQSVMEVKPTDLYKEDHITMATVVRGTLVHFQSVPRSDWPDGVIMDMSGCRSGKMPLLPGSETYQSETCSKLVCSESALLTKTSTCGDGRVCSPSKGCEDVIPRRIG